MSELVVKDNALMNASYNLDLVEQRLILLAIVEARESGKGINANDPLTVHAESYINQFGVARQTAYQALKDACDDLFARQFSYQEINERGNTENVRSRWVSEVRYVDAEATVKLIFAPIVIPLITRLEERFTQYEMKQISELSTGYAIRLYELLICWRATGKTPVIELADFRQRMGVLDSEYQRMYDLKIRFRAISQTNQRAYRHHSYLRTAQKGRVITGFSFKFKQKKPKQAEIATETPKTATNDQNTIKPLTEPQIAKYSMILCKLGSISDLSNFPDYPSFANWIANILRTPEKADEQTAKRIFTALKTETDYSKKN